MRGRVPIHVYATEHDISRFVCNHIAVGLNAPIVPSTELKPGVAVAYGVLRGTGTIFTRCRGIGQNFYQLDHGYWNRTSWKDNKLGFFRVSKNSTTASSVLTDPYYRDIPLTGRFEESLKWHGLKLRPFNSGGRNIIVVQLSPGFIDNHPYEKVNAQQWEQDVQERIKRYTDRPVILKNKSNGKLANLLPNAYAVVCFSSNATVEATIHGVPVVCLGHNGVDELSFKLEDIDDISKIISARDWEARRHEVLRRLAEFQFTLSELQTAGPWKAMGVFDER